MEGSSQAAIENKKTEMCKDCYARGVKDGIVTEVDNTEENKTETPTDEVVAPAE